MMCEHKCIKFCILAKGFYYFDSNSHRRRGLIGPTDGLYEKSEMLLHFINTSMVTDSTYSQSLLIEVFNPKVHVKIFFKKDLKVQNLPEYNLRSVNALLKLNDRHYGL